MGVIRDTCPPSRRDALGNSLDAMIDELEHDLVLIQSFLDRARTVRAELRSGRSYVEITGSLQDGPLSVAVAMITARLSSARSGLQRREIEALRVGGWTTKRIGDALGVTRQRIETVLHGTAAAPTGRRRRLTHATHRPEHV